MAWTYLLFAGLLEVGFTTALRLSEGFSRLGPSLAFFMCAAVSFLSLQKATEEIPLGTAYAVWVGIGAVGTLLVGVALFNEPVNVPRFVFLVTLVGSIIGLRLFSP
ncbi:MAG TPA: multidrug efflux SMR transporter [Rhodomicrobium sp.]|nr:multidrug efflux SMR transporter [Rhodomicrobium sp.]